MDRKRSRTALDRVVDEHVAIDVKPLDGHEEVAWLHGS
jgi:hypothetical protein